MSVRGREATPCLCCGADQPVPLVESRAQMHPAAETFSWVTCGRCGLVYLQPRVPEAEIGRYYEDYLPHRGAVAWGRWASLVEGDQRRIDRARLRTLQRLGSLGPSSHVLDVGCGKPTFLRAVRDATGAQVSGTDFDRGGWSGEPARWEGIQLHAGVLEELPLAGPFDRITLWHALEHLYRPVETLRHLRALAGSGAVIVVEVPDHASLTRRWQGSWWAGYHTPRHTAAYTPRTLRAVLDAAGWRVTQQYRWGTLDPYLLWWLGHQERRGRSFQGSMESRFLPFVAGKIAALPMTLLSRVLPLGFQTAIAVA